jgi:Flp pilus assembly protein TadB
MRDILELLFFPLLVIVVLVVLFLTCVVLPWTNRSRIHHLKAEMNELKNQLQQIFTFLKQEGVKIPLDIINLWQQRQYVQPFNRNSIPDLAAEDTVLKQHVTCSEKKAPNKQKEKVSFEQQFGASFSVWIGGIALALAGFFMIKYSIETGLLTETVRIVLGLIFGCGLLYAANWVRSKSHFANGTQIAQALFYIFAFLQLPAFMI